MYVGAVAFLLDPISGDRGAGAAPELLVHKRGPASLLCRHS